MDSYPQRDTIFEFDYFISSMRSVGCFLFSLLSIRVLLASAASWEIFFFFCFLFICWTFYNQFSLKIINKLFLPGTVTWIIRVYSMFDSS